MAAHTIRIGSFCSGIEGLGLGVKIALRRSRLVVLCERDTYAAAALVARMAGQALDQAPIWDRVDTFPAEEFHGCLDLLIAGYPCQPFSLAGLRRGELDPRHLWPHVRRIIWQSAAPLVFLENVAGHLRLGFGPKTAVEEALQAGASVRADLRAMGYRVTAGLFTAEETGPPHERKRLFILAYRTRGGLRVLRESLWGDGFTDGRGSELADDDLDGLHRIENRGVRSTPRPACRNNAYRCDTELSDAECEPFSPERIDDSRERPAGGTDHRPVPRVGGAELFDADLYGSQTGLSGSLDQARTGLTLNPSTSKLPNSERLAGDPGQRSAAAGRQAGSAHGGRCAELGHAGSSEHAQRRGVDGDAREEQPAAPGAGIPLFPPGRSDRAEWERIRRLRPDLWPAVEPGVRLLVDGPAAMVDQYRGEQLRCIGNAVVPLEAALALTTLTIRAAKRWGIR